MTANTVIGLALFGLGIANAVLAACLLAVGRVYARQQVRRERARYAANDAKTYHTVQPMLLGAAPGSLSYLAGVVQAGAPAGLRYTFRTRETAEINIGTVRVSFDIGTRYHKEES